MTGYKESPKNKWIRMKEYDVLLNWFWNGRYDIAINVPQKRSIVGIRNELPYGLCIEGCGPKSYYRLLLEVQDLLKA